MSEVFIELEDLKIVRYEGYATVYNSEGEKIFDFPKDWTDAMIYIAFKLADFAYSCGIRDGKTMFEIRVREAAELLSSLGVKVKE